MDGLQYARACNRLSLEQRWVSISLSREKICDYSKQVEFDETHVRGKSLLQNSAVEEFQARNSPTDVPREPGQKSAGHVFTLALFESARVAFSGAWCVLQSPVGVLQ